ncbi:MAG TPA: MFS transporter, partial [Vicinamibacterales bacterium]|nr:MFS transporter [Vicinamibacterales bacterium]
AARVGLGISEAAAAPAAQSMIADLFSRGQRTAALSVLAVAGPIGTMAAFIAGGALNQVVGWRMTMVTLGVPGVMLAALLLLTVREPRRGASEHQRTDATAYDLAETIRYLWNLRSLRWLTAGASLNLFAAYATVVWSAPFLIRVHGMTTEQAGTWLGITTGVGGMAGTVLGGLVIQRLARSDTRWMLRGPALSSALAAPFIVLFLTLPSPAAPAANLGAALFGSCMIGPVMAVTQTLAKVAMRARAAALVGLTFNLVGAGLGPLTVGMLSDSLRVHAGDGGVRYALLLSVTTALVAAAVSFARGARHIRHELL